MDRVPSISCLMVTLPVPGRLAAAQRSILDYCAQTWPNKELVMVLDHGAEPVAAALRTFVAELGRDDIRLLQPTSKLNLGGLRNASVAAATGTLTCHWDDDDRHHPQRLERQAACLLEGDREAVLLQEVMQYFPRHGTMFWTNYRATPAQGHPGTLMARRATIPRYPTDGAPERPEEDLAVAQALIARGRTGWLAGAAPLFVYVSHGANAWHDGHHAMLSETLAISQALLRRREQAIRDGLQPFAFPPGTVTVRGSNGEGFVL